MVPTLTDKMARVVIEDRVEAAERFRRQKQARVEAAGLPDVYDSVIVRFAGEEDAAALRDLAERDGRREPRSPLLLAEVHGDVLAARSLADGRSIADPFRHSAHLVELLALRTAHLRGDNPKPGRGRARERLAFILHS
jgi:hypothetical protein